MEVRMANDKTGKEWREHIEKIRHDVADIIKASQPLDEEQKKSVAATLRSLERSLKLLDSRKMA